MDGRSLVAFALLHVEASVGAVRPRAIGGERVGDPIIA
jgi:hypothetical protein